MERRHNGCSVAIFELENASSFAVFEVVGGCQCKLVKGHQSLETHTML